MLKNNRITDIEVYGDILEALNRRKTRQGVESTNAIIIRKYVQSAIEVDSPISYSNYNTTLRNCMIALNYSIRTDNGFIKRTESNLLVDLERELKKPYQCILEEELDYHD